MGDLSHWDLQEHLSIHEVARLAAGVEPHLHNSDLTPEQLGKYALLAKLLEEDSHSAWRKLGNMGRKFASLRAENRAPWEVSDTDFFPLESVVLYLPSVLLFEAIEDCYFASGKGEAEMNETINRWVNGMSEGERFSRTYIQNWFDKRKFEPSYMFLLADPANKKELVPFTDETDPNFRSSKLTALIEASRLFWGGHSKLSRADHPTNDKVAVWLEKNGFSASLAKEGAKIIRPDWSVTGRPPEN
jgi:hypothetical protein